MKLTLRILVVEDSEDDALLNLLQIKKGGYDIYYERVETAETFIAAINTKDWDIILADYVLPQFSGLKALLLLKETGKEIPFIIISGTIGEDVAVEAMKSGAHDYLMKNNLHRLLPAVERELRESAERTEKRALEQKQKQVEENLQASEERYRMLFEASADGIVITDVETKTFKYVNPTLCQMLGYSEEELKTMGITDIHSKQDLQWIIAEFESQVHGDKTLAHDIPCLRKDGSIVYADINTTKTQIDGRICTVSIFRDITGRKRMEEALLRVNKAVESSSDAICMSDPQGNHFYHNKAYTEVFKYTMEEIEAAGGGTAIYANKKVAHKIFDIIMGGGMWKGEVEMISRTGRKFTVLLRADSIKDENGVIVGLVGIHTDMTKRKLAEKALKDSETRARALIDAIPDMIFRLNKQGVCIDYKAYKEELADQTESVIGKKIRDIMPPDFAGLVDDKMRLTLQTGQMQLFEYQLPWPNKGISEFEARMVQGSPDEVIVIVRDVTERRQAEEALRESEARYRLLFETSADGILITDMETKAFKYANPALCRMLGYSEEELKTMGMTDIYPRKNQQQVIAEFESQSRGDKTLAADIPCLRKDGSIVYADINTTKTRIDGRMCIVGIFRDITERRLAEEKLRNSEERLKVLFDYAPDAYYLSDLKGVFLDGNIAAEKLLGYDKNVLIGKSFLKLHLLSSDQILKAAKLLAKNMMGQSTGPDEFVLNRKDRSKVTVEIGTHPIKIKEQTVVLGIARDITKRKQAEVALQKSELRFKQVSENAQEWIWEVDKNGLFTYVSPVVKEILGYVPEEIIGKKHFYDFFKLEEKEEIKLFSFELFARKKSFKDIISTNIHKNGKEVILSTSGVPLLENEKKLLGYRGLNIDITERIHAEEEIKIKNEQLLKVNAEKDKFFSIIAHDLRGPFGGFIGLTKLLVDGLPNLSMDKIQSYALKMRDSAVNFFYLLENLLQWANMQRGLTPFEPEVFQLYQVIEECLVTVKDPAQKKRIEITTDIPHQLKVLADSNMLKSVIRNLVSNAIKFTPHEGKINLSARTAGHENIEIAIKDSGIGMNKKMVDDLFRIDAKTNRPGTDNEPSSGLGLLLCKEFIEKHDGEIWVESEEKNLSAGKAGGTTFYFVIPQKIAPEEQNKFDN